MPTKAHTAPQAPPDDTPAPLAMTLAEDPGPAPSRTIQITIAQSTHVLLSRLCTRWVEKGNRPARCTKSALINAAIAFLAQAEGLTGPLGPGGQGHDPK